MDGLFLLRPSIRHPGDYTLSVSYNSGVEHYRIKYKGNRFTIDDEIFFSNLEELVKVKPRFRHAGFASPFASCRFAVAAFSDVSPTAKLSNDHSLTFNHWLSLFVSPVRVTVCEHFGVSLLSGQYCFFILKRSLAFLSDSDCFDVISRFAGEFDLASPLSFIIPAMTKLQGRGGGGIFES